MAAKQHNISSGKEQAYDDVKYALYCDSLEKQYNQA